MKFWNYSFWLSIASAAILCIMSLLPNSYNAFSWQPLPGDAASTLFPVMCICWLSSLVAIAMNNVFLDKCYITNKLKLSGTKKYLPSLIALPSVTSFVWFCCRCYSAMQA